MVSSTITMPLEAIMALRYQGTSEKRRDRRVFGTPGGLNPSAYQRLKPMRR